MRYGVFAEQDAEAPAPAASAAAAAGGSADARARVVVSSAVVASTLAALHWLRDSRMLCLEGNKWAPRPLGLATHASGLLPEEALIVRQARLCVLEAVVSLGCAVHQTGALALR